jgi:hypothetical protein
MKKLFITLLIPAFVFGVMASCGGGGKEYSEESDEAEDTTEETMEEGPTYSGKTVVGIVHSVADYSSWLTVYEEDSDPAARLAIYSNVDNPSEIVVFQLTTSHAEAKEGLSSEELKATMERAGVNSEPVMTFYDIQYMNEESTDAIYRVAINHEVKDFTSWKEKFDADENRRAEAGLELRALATGADNPNMVYMFWATNDLEPMKGMLSDPDMKKTMEDAGVISEPATTFWKVIGS